MTTKEKFEELKMRELKATDGKEVSLMQTEFDRLADEDPEGFEAAFIGSARNTLQDVKRLKIKEQMR